MSDLLLAAHQMKPHRVGMATINENDRQPGTPLYMDYTGTGNAIRASHPIFRRRRWFQGRKLHGTDVGDIGWYTPAGTQMSEEEWAVGFAKSLGIFLNGKAIASMDERGEQVFDSTFYALFNAHSEPITFTLPQELGTRCRKLIDTNDSMANTSGDLRRLHRDSGARPFGHPHRIPRRG